MLYRPEVDGLRTLAVVPVVLFHAGLTVFSGGFVGVDVFFVISGFLITSIIKAEIERGRFSILEFYKRRVLRILPAYGVVMLATLAAAFYTMLPAEFAATGESIVASSLFVSNIYFWMNSGYFDAASETQPLLHTWSLSVEEQFYVFFPILMLIIGNIFRSRFALWIGIISAASFVLAVVAVAKAPSAAFYLLPSRVWELGLGALVAVVVPWRHGDRRVANAASALGSLFILVSVFHLTEADPFPGYNALLPCVGAALILAYGSGTWAGAVLSTKPFVFIGKISYSLYLWHWPVIVFYKTITYTGNAILDAFVVCVVSLLLATASYVLVEQPFRSPEWRARSATMVVSAGTAVLALFIVAGGLLTAGLDPRQFPPEVLRIANYTKYRETADYKTQFTVGDCFISGSDEAQSFDVPKCLETDPAKRDYLVLGDSHAAQYWRALQEAFPEINFLQATISGCRPVLDSSGNGKCRAAMNDIIRKELQQRKIDGVIVAARWKPEDIGKIGPTLAIIKRQVTHVVVFGPTVEYEGDYPPLLASAILNGNSDALHDRILFEKKELSEDVEEAVQAQGVPFVDVFEILCGADTCIERSPDGGPMQFDYGHLTLDGSAYVVGRARQIWQPDTGKTARINARS